MYFLSAQMMWMVLVMMIVAVSVMMMTELLDLQGHPDGTPRRCWRLVVPPGEEDAVVGDGQPGQAGLHSLLAHSSSNLPCPLYTL